MRKRTLLTFLSLVCVLLLQAQQPSFWQKELRAPNFAIKSNLLYDATSTVNLGVEFKVSNKWTLDLPFNYNAWDFSGNKKLKHFLVQPEFRYWTCERFNGHFLGLHAHYGIYNVGGLSDPFFSKFMKEHRFEGWLVGAGVSYGYQWVLSPRWGIEATLGVGYAFMDQDVYECKTCGDKLSEDNKHYFGPTKVGVTLIYTIK